MEQKFNEIRLNTYESYAMTLNRRIIPFYKPLKLTLSSIAPQHIHDFYNAMIKEGLTANTVHKQSVIIRGALEDAVKKNIIQYNPVDRATSDQEKICV